MESGAFPEDSWYNLEIEMQLEQTPEPMMFVTIGYLGEHNDIDYENKSFAGLATQVSGFECEPSVSQRKAFRPVRTSVETMNGLSGAPVFGVYEFDGAKKVQFAGTVSEASSTKVHYIPFDQYRGIISELVNSSE